MKPNNTPDPVRRDNRKNWPKFAAVLLACMAGGAVLGYCSAWLLDTHSFAPLTDAAWHAAGVCAPFAVLAAVPFLLAALVCYRRAVALAAAWDGEDDALPARAEARLNWACVWLTAAQLLELLLFSVTASLFPLGHITPGVLLLAVGEFLTLFLAGLILNGRIVDLVRRLNPEKQGSVYDFKFRQKWLASCDEAERQRIGQASFVGFRAGGEAGLFTAVVLMALGALLPIGPLPSLAVMIPWSVGQLAYLAECIRMENR